ncbi:MAG: MBOAT family protein [Butyrivibrio sp.]|nr:MBOAT family protein [Butyrivibrio sp.]
MIFSSIPFLVYFFPIVFLGYYILSFSRMAQNIWLLIASLLFYAWGEPIYVFLMIGSILFNSIIAIIIEKVKGQKLKKGLLVFSIVGNISVLFVFKYLMFVVGIVNSAFAGLLPEYKITLPIGISFFTFQALSYVVDVYRGTTKAENPFYVGLYVAFFPQLIAGPIVQYNSIAEQIRSRKSSIDKVALGLSRFAVGVGKKILIANNLAIIANEVFNWSLIGSDKLAVPATLAWLGSIAYSLQLYFDFSAYSDMAIGLGLCFGFKFKENFNYPYVAGSISEFWKRWHISLTDWFRDYVYIPLGGNRVANKDTMVRNLAIVWLLTGIWHGANWTFIVWGMFFFAFQLFERILDFDNHVHNEFFKHVYTLLIVNFQWVLFRADDIYQAGRFYLNMFGLNNNGILSQTALMFVREYWMFLLAGIIFSTPIIPMLNKWFHSHEKTPIHVAYSIAYPVLMSVMVIVCISYLVIGSYNPFIYFNF